MTLLPKNRKRRQRFLLVLAMIALVGGATALILLSFEKNLMYFYTPSDIVQQRIQPHGVFELGGMVLSDSLKRSDDGLQIEFIVGDGLNQLPVHYRGALPDLFREGQGVVVYGRLSEGAVYANRILAKHDENYMPPHLERELNQTNPQHSQPRSGIPEQSW